jgi:hypothetical protein
VDLGKLSRDDMIVGGLGLFLVLDLVALPWYSVPGIAVSATMAPYAIWGVLALLVDIAFLSDLALDRFAKSQLPALGGSQARTRAALAGGTLFFMIIKFVLDTSDVGAGAWLGLLAAIAVVVLCAREVAT